jgi:para-nitrobenzyl esterase
MKAIRQIVAEEISMSTHCNETKLSRLAVRSIIVAFALALAGAFSAAPALAHNPAIVTRNGTVKGISLYGEELYLGIPYAVPPVGNLRWMPPVPSGRFPGGVFQANDVGNSCTQPGSFGPGSEDCLTLNVVTPNIKKNSDNKKPVPVMVWIHGGGLLTGGSFLYEPSPLVLGGNVIVVTINYRLGLLGFFAHQAIDAEGHPSGNYGLMDQQLALKWVNDNIAAFGGDPKRITIFGESSGGQSVYANLASPTAAGLFEGAIQESGAGGEFQDYFNFIVSLSDGETVGVPGQTPSGDSVATALGCPGTTAASAACLRGLPASAVIANEPGSVFPFVDGTILTKTPTEAFASGDFNRVPVISGGNHDEGRYFVALQYDFTGHPLVTMADYDSAVTALYGSPLDSFVEALYPLSNYGGIPGIALGASETDGIRACPTRNSVKSLSQFVTTYAYEFNDENAPDLFDPVATFPLGAYHFAEVQYLFNFDERFAGFNPFTPGQQSLSAAMVGYWTRFAATGNPNSADEPAWPPYTAATDEFQSLVPPTPVTEPTGAFDADHFCSLLWNAF